MVPRTISTTCLRHTKRHKINSNTTRFVSLVSVYIALPWVNRIIIRLFHTFRCDSFDCCTEGYEIVVLLPNSELTKGNNMRVRFVYDGRPWRM